MPLRRLSAKRPGRGGNSGRLRRRSSFLGLTWNPFFKRTGRIIRSNLVRVANDGGTGGVFFFPREIASATVLRTARWLRKPNVTTLLSATATTTRSPRGAYSAFWSPINSPGIALAENRFVVSEALPKNRDWIVTAYVTRSVPEGGVEWRRS
jgi:hypothetical protein